MRVKLSLKTDILVVPQEFAFLDIQRTRSSLGTFTTYEVRYSINGLKAVKEKALTVKIQLSRNIPNKQPPPVLSDVESPTGLAGVDTYGLLGALRVRTQEIKDTIRANRSSFFFSYNSDWTAFVSNDKTDSLVAGNRNGASTISYKSVVQYTNAPISELVASDNIPPVLATQTLTLSDTTPIGDNLFRSSTDELLFFNRTHPTEIFTTKQSSIASTKKMASGIKQNRAKSYVAQNVNTAFILENAINSYGTAEPVTYDRVPEDTQISLPNITEETLVNVTELLEIPSNLIGSFPFYITFDLVDTKGNLIQREVRLVEHGKNFVAASSPTAQPILKAYSSTVGRNVLEVSHNGAAGEARGVKLYRKIEHTSSPNTNAEYTYIGKIDIYREGDSVLTPTVTVADLCDNYNPVVYRAICYGEDGVLGAEFATQTTTPPEIPIGFNTSPALNKRKFVSLSHEIVSNGIKITAKDIPPGTVDLQFYRTDFMEELAEEKPLGRKQFVGDLKTELSVIDTFVYPEHIYEYRCQFIDRYGNVDDSSTVITVEYTPEVSTFITTEIQNIKAVEGVELDVTFNIKTTVVPGSEDNLKKALEQQGLLSFFGGNITRDSLQQLIAYEVVRTNITTGEIENLGTVVGESFSDIAVGRPMGVTPLIDGNEYKYTVTTFLRDATTALKGNVVTRNDPNFPNNPNKTYTFEPYYWQGPLALKKGTLATSNAVHSITSKSEFTLGEVGSVVEARISLASSMPGIIEPTASKVNVINPAVIRVSWRVTGVATKIDHFIIMQEHLGMVTRVGCCHNLTSNNTFEFFDRLTDDESGELGYLIIPIYYDFSIGKTASTNKVVV